MTPQPTCTTCGLVFSSEDTVSFNRGRLTHFDCRRPRTLSAEERLVLATYCWNHAVASCPTCARAYRLPELLSVLVDGRTHVCPFCDRDLVESARAHLYACPMLPARVRQRARAVRETAQRLVKRSHELSDVADVLMRQTEVLVQSLHEAMRNAPRRRG